jgi:hypothetical protein
MHIDNSRSQDKSGIERRSSIQRDLIHYYTTRMPAQEGHKIFYLFHGEYARK